MLHRLRQRLIRLGPRRQPDLLHVRVHRLGHSLVHVRRPGGTQQLHRVLGVGHHRGGFRHVVADLPELLDLVVAGHGIEPIGGDELRRDPARAHRLEHVRVVVRDEVVDDAAVDADGVVEALVALDELLDGDGAASLHAAGDERLFQLAGVVAAVGPGGARRVAGLHGPNPAGRGRRAD